jgi:hypothetical protein
MFRDPGASMRPTFNDDQAPYIAWPPSRRLCPRICFSRSPGSDGFVSRVEFFMGRTLWDVSEFMRFQLVMFRRHQITGGG